MSAQEPPLRPAIVNELPASFNMPADVRRGSMASSRPSLKARGFRAGVGLENVARRTLGIFLLSATVFLWTASNFLASYILADNTYSKPYFLTYINTSAFAISLPPILLRLSHRNAISEIWEAVLEFWPGYGSGYKKMQRSTGDDTERPTTPSEARLLGDEQAIDAFPTLPEDPEAKLSLRETARLSLQFSLLWFIANYLMAACLEYTSVASSTILTSTSSIWTLILGAAMHVEHFTYKKLIGVLASLTGIILISSVDLAGKDNDDNRGSFPHKDQAQIAVGDTMALGSAVMYGLYIVIMKKRIGNEDRVNMPLFFGLVGLFNVVFLWPGFIILHFTGIETFELPPASRVWTIIILNSLSSFVSDYCWAYAMLLTSPLVVTVGLSMTIPLSLIGQIVLSSQYSGAWYWVGACVVFVSFLFINHETREDEPSKPHPATLGDERLYV